MDGLNSTSMRFGKVIISALAFVALLALVLFGASSPSKWADDTGFEILSASEFLDHVKFLAKDGLKGRGNGTPELDLAAQYIAGKFKEFGLQPGGEAGSYFQKFKVTTSVELGPNNALKFSPGTTTELKINEDYIPLSFSETDQVSSEILFAGYGITAEEYQYDDYKSIDVKDKIVLVLDHEPQEPDGRSKFNGKSNTHHATFTSKAVNAKNHGAKALLLVRDVANHPKEKEDFARGRRHFAADDLGIIALRVKSSVIDSLLSPMGTSLHQLQSDIDKSLTPESFPLHGIKASIRTDAERLKKEVKNVVAYLPGNNKTLSKELIVIGAHYDHLGLGERSSLAPKEIGHIHHGADDNASGTAGLLQLAKAFAQSKARLERSLVFIAFAGEELGLLGSSYYTKNPLFPLDKTVAMLNMDMIGRPKNNRIHVGGAGTSPQFADMLAALSKQVGLEADLSKSGYGSSDHTSFTIKSIPTLFFFSGLHSDYHKPSDTWDKIDSASAQKVLRLVYLVTMELDHLPERPQYTKVREEMPVSAGGGSGYGPYFGSIPDFAGDVKGVRFADIRENSPAAKSGIKAGDVLIRFDGKEIENLQDFTYALRSRRPGDSIEVLVLRGEQRLTFKVKLEERK